VPSGNVILHMVKVPVRDGSLGITGLCGIARDITERRIAEQRLVKKEQELASQARRLEEMNIALKVLWETSEKEKRQTLGIIAARIRRSLAPHLELLQQALRDERGAAILSVVKANLEEVLALDSSPYIRLTKRLTPMELKVADLIRMGKSSKEIASVLGVSTHAVSFHRANIRRKCNLRNARRNLRAHLLSLDEDSEVTGST